MIIVHHLRIGRPIFTLWLLEELGLDYELKIYDRNPDTGRAPPELREAHPLGKSPVLEIDGVVLAESGAITAHLIESYDDAGALTPKRSDHAAWLEHLQWLHYPEGSAFLPMIMQMLLKREDPRPPVIGAFADAETKLHLDYMTEKLGETDFLLGDRLQAADFGVGYVCSMAARLKLLDGHPTLAAYAKRLMARDAFQRALEKAGA